MSEYEQQLQNQSLTEIATSLELIADELRISNRVAWISAQWATGHPGDDHVLREIGEHFDRRRGTGDAG